MYECPRCFKRCGNAGALKTHMKTHNKPEPKSGSMWKWVVKRAPVKSKPKKAEKTAIELKPIVKTRQLKLRKQPVRDPSVIPNPIQPRPPRRPSRSKQEPIDTSPFAAPPELIHPDPIFICILYPDLKIPSPWRKSFLSLKKGDAGS